MTAPLRLLLWVIAAADVLVGVVAEFTPHFFYRHVVGMDLLGAYNEHLLTDVGGFYLAFGVLFAFAAWTLDRAVARAASVALLVASLLHLGFHSVHLDHFTAAEATIELVLLTVGALAPIGVLLLIRRHAGSRTRARVRSRRRRAPSRPR